MGVVATLTSNFQELGCTQTRPRSTVLPEEPSSPRSYKLAGHAPPVDAGPPVRRADTHMAVSHDALVRPTAYEHDMEKSLAVVGNSLALVIEKPIRRMLGLTKNTLLRVTTDGRRIVIEPIGRKDDRLAQLTEATSFPTTALTLAEELELRPILNALLNKYAMGASEMAQLHHAPVMPLESPRTVTKYSSWISAAGFKRNDLNELATSRRLRVCFDSLCKGKTWPEAITDALAVFPLPVTASSEP
jgi:antitoxin component of MazEF toxin-antitoxin module